MSNDFKTERFEVVIIEDVADNSKKIYALISPLRIKSFDNVPEGIVVKSIRGSDDGGYDCAIDHYVLVNHNEDLIIKPGQSVVDMEALLVQYKGSINIYDYENLCPDEPAFNTHTLNYIDQYLSYDDFVKMEESELNSLV